ncbi:MAG: helix-turn-helix domain-containing protein [Chloroflexota bacterium]|nr:helix-turn-helix domain-containing protein [Chloroflexota bacterium]
MRTLHHPARNDIMLAEVLYALSDPTRLRIVANLAKTTEDSCGALGGEIAKSTVSHHCKVLREAGITHTRIEGTQHLISLRREDLDARFPGLLESIVRAAELSPV